MRDIEAVLRLRPSNVIGGLSGRTSSVCLLNARDVRRAVAMASTNSVLVEVPAAVVPVALGALRAASHLEAVIGLCAPACHLGEGPRPQEQFAALIAAVEEIGFQWPLFLQAGPIVLSSLHPKTVATVSELVFKYVDAGFTEICVDLSQLEPRAEVAEAVAQVTALARERELSIELTVSRVDPVALGEWTTMLGQHEVRVDSFTVPMVPTVMAYRYHQMVENVLPAALRESLASWQRSSLTGISAALGRFHREISQLDSSTHLRLEAFAYYETLEQLGAAKAENSGPRVVKFLAEKSGY